MSFDTTRWSIILRAKDTTDEVSRAAMESLCEIYWQPLYVFIRQKGRSVEDAEDLLQSFFSHLLSRDFLKNVNPELGKFRTFLLTSLTRFMINENKRENRLKRNEGRRPISIDTAEAEQWYALQPRDLMTPDKLFERRWALGVMERTIDSLRALYAKDGKLEHFNALRPYITNDTARLSYSELAKLIGLSEGAVKVAVHRLRARYRDVLRRDIADTVGSEEDIDAEIRYLIGIFAE